MYKRRRKNKDDLLPRHAVAILHIIGLVDCGAACLVYVTCQRLRITTLPCLSKFRLTKT